MSITGARLDRLLTRRAELLRQAAQLRNATLAKQFGVSTAYVSRRARMAAADPRALHEELRAALDQDTNARFILWQGRDGGIRVRPLDESLIECPGFVGVCNATTTVTDIEEMLKGCDLD